MSWFKKLFGKKETKVQAAPAAKPQPTKVESPYLTQTVVFGMHQYRRPGEDSSVYFVDENRGIRKMLVDSRGRFQNFPGICEKDKPILEKEVSARALAPQICFRTSFEKREEKWIVFWEVQPDGRYWEDEDGFGGTNDEEVRLYTYVDSNGDFTDPFRIYDIGIKKYYQVPRWCFPVDKAKQLPPEFQEYLQKWQSKLIGILESGKVTWHSKSVSTTFVYRSVHYQLKLEDICSKEAIAQYQYGICAAAFEILQKTITDDLEAIGAGEITNFGSLD